MLIIEGPDGAGKTTLAKKILARWLADDKPISGFMRFGLLPPHWDHFHDNIFYIKPYMLVDRFTWSEHVYGPIIRGVSRITDHNQAILSCVLRQRKALTVYLRPSVTSSLKNRKPGDIFSNHQVEMAVRRYEDMRNGQEMVAPDKTDMMMFDTTVSFVTDADISAILYRYDSMQESL